MSKNHTLFCYTIVNSDTEDDLNSRQYPTALLTKSTQVSFINDKSLFDGRLTKEPITVNMQSTTKKKFNFKGSVRLGDNGSYLVEDVWYDPHAPVNLINVEQFCSQNGLEVRDNALHVAGKPYSSMLQPLDKCVDGRNCITIFKTAIGAGSLNNNKKSESTDMGAVPSKPSNNNNNNNNNSHSRMSPPQEEEENEEELSREKVNKLYKNVKLPKRECSSTSTEDVINAMEKHDKPVGLISSATNITLVSKRSLFLEDKLVKDPVRVEFAFGESSVYTHRGTIIVAGTYPIQAYYSKGGASFVVVAEYQLLDLGLSRMFNKSFSSFSHKNASSVPIPGIVSLKGNLSFAEILTNDEVEYIYADE
ncbi:hypothetical protein DASC09_045590 [Saccharomycopsis crataegensis]|uniref:Uncharacterized protein n=1 Tax=Saccharomycopsis crataegensis TaxID=43959 RepID=A0AAV5QR73_9ASCO|nr:hypothetical protein DASC09_045590 [Saccharomycopsis crataegensis]